MSEWLRAPPEPREPEPPPLPRDLEAERAAADAKGLPWCKDMEPADTSHSPHTWSLDVRTGAWMQLSTAPKKHFPGSGGYFYQDGDVLRDAAVAGLA